MIMNKNRLIKSMACTVTNRNRLIKGMACTMTIAVVVTNIGSYSVSAYAADNNTHEKEEVVYIITDATGRTDSVNVVNIFGKGNITDYGDYSDVKMLNSTDDIKLNGGKVTFNTNNAKVYYQGTLNNADIPWNINISYELNGKSVKLEQLAGANGKLKIHISITENEHSNVSFYDQYALQAAFTLDTDKCDNIVANGATIANVGSDKQISYTVLPGKGLDADITADVTDFEMEAATINGVKMNLEIDVDDSELNDKINEIKDAVKELNDGAKELTDGSGQLVDGGSSLSDGAGELSDGMQSLDGGIGTLNDGVIRMQTALDTLNSSSGVLSGSSNQLLDAMKLIQSRLSAISASTEQIQQLTESSAAIKKGIEETYKGAVLLQKNISYDQYKNVMKSNGLDIDTLQAGNSQAINSLMSQIADLTASVNMLKSIPGYEGNEEYVKQVAQLKTQIDSLTNIVTLLNGNNAAIMGTESYLNAASASIGQLVDGLNQLNENYALFDTAIQQLTGTMSDMLVNVSELRESINQLVAGYSSLDAGIEDYTNGVASIVAAYSDIVDGTNTLANGSKSLVDGVVTLKDGTDSLYDGIIELDDGALQLQDGMNEFYDKTYNLDSEVRDRIDDMIDEISGGDEPVVSYVSDKNENVKSVQFVIKTTGIKKNEDISINNDNTIKKSFWQKLVNLFRK